MYKARSTLCFILYWILKIGGVKVDIQLKKEKVAINETLMRDNRQVVVEGDIIVPDIKSDMAKILQIDAAAMVEKIDVFDKSISVSGSVSLNILYVPEGDRAPLCSICTSLPFETQIENQMVCIGSSCSVCADAYHVEFSMLNSRKLSVKVVLELDTRCSKENNAEIICDVSSDKPIEKNMRDFVIYNLVDTSQTKLAINETLDFPSGKPSALSVLRLDAKICDKDVRLVTGKIVVKGNIDLCTLYVSDSGSLEFMEHEIPFTEVLDAPNATENCMCDLDIDICKTDFSLRADIDGDMRLLDVEIMLCADISVSENTNMSAICDCFCAEQKLVCETKTFCFDSLIGRGKSQEALRASITLPEGAPELLSVYNIIAKPYISNIDVEQDKAIVHGMIDCYLLYLSDSSASPVSTQKAQAEFEIPVSINGLCSDMDCCANIEIAHLSYNITMSGEIELRIALIAQASAVCKKEIALVSDIFADMDAPIDIRRGIIIYFVRPGDTVWKIAKKYNVAPTLIAEINNLENPDVLNIGQRLLIPNNIK